MPSQIQNFENIYLNNDGTLKNASIQPYNLASDTSSVVGNATSALTLTAANILGNALFQQTGTTAATFTIDTGANLSIATIGLKVGYRVDFTVVNSSTATITMAGSTGSTLANAMTVLTLQSRTFHAINTGTNTWTIY